MGLIKRLRDTEPFNHLPEDIYAEFDQATEIRKYSSRTPIFSQHDPPTGYLYVIKTGQVEIIALTPGGVEMVVDIREAGGFCGGTPVFTKEDYTAGARTVIETECYLIPQELIVRVADRFPQISEFFTKEIHSRVRNLYSDIVSEHAGAATLRMEAYPFQKRLVDIMSSPAETCPPTVTAQVVGRQMLEKSVSSILVTDQQGKLLGIITEKDLVAKVIAPLGTDCHLALASDIMTPQPRTMSASNYMYEAIAFIQRYNIKHLPIMDGEQLVGIVTLRELMRYRSQKAMLLIGRAKEARSYDELSSIKAEITRVAKALMSEARSTIETMEIMSYIHHCIQQRTYDLALEEMEQQGLVLPDIRYCFIIMGSGGRKEMLLGPDQDSGFIFENFPDEKKAEVDAFFIPFAEKLVDIYDQIGYPRCKGKVMVNNPLWRGRLKEWQARIADWINAPEPQKVRYSTIFFDFMPLIGDPSLCQDLRNIVHQQIRKFPLFLYHMMELDFQHKVPLGLMGRFILDKDHKGKLSTKQTGSIFIVDCVRMFMLEKQLDATTTIERLEQLVKANIFNQETAEHIQAAYEAFTYLRLRTEIALVEQGKPPSHYLDPYALSKDEQELLREAFRVASKLQDSTKRHFNVG